MFPAFFSGNNKEYAPLLVYLCLWLFSSCFSYFFFGPTSSLLLLFNVHLLSPVVLVVGWCYLAAI